MVIPTRATATNIKSRKASANPARKRKIPQQKVDLEKELHQLHSSIEDLKQEIQKLSDKPTKTKQFFHWFLIGSAKGLGFLFATTIIAASLVYLGQQALKASNLQTIAKEQIEILIDSVANKTTTQLINTLNQ